MSAEQKPPALWSVGTNESVPSEVSGMWCSSSLCSPSRVSVLEAKQALHSSSRFNSFPLIQMYNVCSRFKTLNMYLTSVLFRSSQVWARLREAPLTAPLAHHSGETRWWCNVTQTPQSHSATAPELQAESPAAGP